MTRLRVRSCSRTDGRRGVGLPARSFGVSVRVIAGDRASGAVFRCIRLFAELHDLRPNPSWERAVSSRLHQSETSSNDMCICWIRTPVSR